MKIIYLKENNQAKIEEIIKKNYFEDDAIEEIEKDVKKIISRVKEEGDSALLEFTAKYDKVDLISEDLLVKPVEFEIARKKIDYGLLDIIKEAISRIKKYHLHQKENSWFTTDEEGVILGQIFNPVERVGLYIPGGTAAYPSTLMMSAIPAMIAGVKEIAVVNPPASDGKINPYVLATAEELHIREIYKIGGAQSIAALAFGTETIKKVNKIVGPGNTYVTLAKKNVFGIVDIDMMAGPSEILIWADENADARFIACDLLSQAEHDREATSILITDSTSLAKRVKAEIEGRLESMERKEIIKISLMKQGRLIVAEDEKMIIDFINNFAPEHLELQIENPWQKLGNIRNAGSIFLGAYSPEPLGDYWAGPNHIIPTSRGARSFSPLTVNEFIKKSSIICFDQERLVKDGKKIASLARLEGLDAHARSIEIRYEES